MRSRRFVGSPWRVLVVALVVAPVVALVAGCAGAPAVRVQQLDTGVACPSIGRMPLPADAPPATIVDQRLDAEILRWLAAAGVDTRAAAPACWVRHSTATRLTIAPSSGVSVGVGGGSWGRSGSSVGVGVGITLPVGEPSRRDVALTIEFIDAARRQQAWVGTLDDALRAAPSDAEIAGAVDTILARARPVLAR
jgi:hypothetical protein